MGVCKTGDCYRRWRWRIWTIVVAQLLAVFLWFWVARALAQSQETINANVTYQISELYRRIAEVEGQGAKSLSTAWDLDARMRLLEHDMNEVKWLGRSVAAAVIGQLVIAGMGWRRRKGEDE